jgi:hypothetical protein
LPPSLSYSKVSFINEFNDLAKYGARILVAATTATLPPPPTAADQQRL